MTSDVPVGSRREREHVCHAEACKTHVPPKMFMCRKHWYMVPKALRDEVWLEYAVGQEIRMDPSPEYLDVAHRAVEAVAIKEGRRELPLGEASATSNPVGEVL